MAEAHSKSGGKVNKALKTKRFYTAGYAPKDKNSSPLPP